MHSFSESGAARLTIAGSELSENIAGKSGGGLQVCTKREDDESDISELSVYNSTISGNTAGHTTGADDPGAGGGAHLAIYNIATDDEEALDARFQNTTITKNTADVGGGVFSLKASHGPPRTNDVRLTNSIISGNHQHDDDDNNLFGSFNVTETVFNIIGPGNTIYDHLDHDPATLSGNIPDNDNDPDVAALAFNGGLTRTHRPLSTSDAIDAGSNTLAVIPFTSTPLETDQRGAGYLRRVYVTAGSSANPVVDIGAFEVNLVGAPKIVNVVLKGTGWGTINGADVEYSYAERVAAGHQLRPMFMQGANRIEVHFDVPVVFPSQPQNALSVITDRHLPIAATIGWDANSSTSTKGVWTLSSPLLLGKFALMVSGITDADGLGLDGDYTNFRGPDANTHTYDDFSDDKRSHLISGDGQPGGGFEFHFSVLPGDYNQNGMIDAEDDNTGVVKDGNGDGVINGADTAITAGHPANTMLPFRITMGDYADVDNDVVDADDYLKWRATFGFTQPPLPADGNVNGVVDAADYPPSGGII